MTELVYAPWTTEQVQALNSFQERGGLHPLTCAAEHALGRSPVLDATHSGWICPDPQCTYTQDWAHAFMTQPPTRVRLFGGRNTHATQPGRMGRVTPCGYPVGRHDHWIPDDESVTCPACKRALAKAANR